MALGLRCRLLAHPTASAVHVHWLKGIIVLFSLIRRQFLLLGRFVRSEME